MTTRKLIGIISDTHGLVRPQALEALAGVDMILHAGDIGNQEVLDTLNEVAPVVACAEIMTRATGRSRFLIGK